MRDLVFKNLTSLDGRRKKIASCEIVDKEGVHSVIRRHFVCTVQEIADADARRPDPYLRLLKEKNTQEQREKFFCKIKSNMLAVNQHKIYLIRFMHTLKITLTPQTQNIVNC